MERALKTIGLVLSALVAAGVIGGAVSRSVAVDQVRPVSERVRTLEAHRENDKEDIREIKRDVKEILRRVR